MMKRKTKCHPAVHLTVKHFEKNSSSVHRHLAGCLRPNGSHAVFDKARVNTECVQKQNKKSVNCKGDARPAGRFLPCDRREVGSVFCLRKIWCLVSDAGGPSAGQRLLVFRLSGCPSLFCVLRGRRRT